MKKQTNEKDCGLHVIEYFIRKLLHKSVTIEKLKENITYNENGISLKELTSLAKFYGLEMRSFEVTPKDLFEANINQEFISLINTDGFNHFVVANISGSVVKIKDSARGEYVLQKEDFSKQFLNVIVLVEKAHVPESKPKDEIVLKKKPEIKSLQSWLGNKPYLFGIGTISIIISIALMFISTIFTKVILDKVIPHHLENTLVLMTIMFSFIACLRVINMLIKSIIIKKLQNSYELELLNVFKQKLFTASKLDRFTQNDILRRWSYISGLSSMYANGFFVVFNEVIVFIVSMGLIMWMSPSSFAIVLAFGFAMVLNIVCFSILSKKHSESLFEKQLVQLNATHDFVRNVQVIKTPQIFKRLSGRINDAQVELKKNEMSMFGISIVSKVAGEVINLVAPIVITYINAVLIFDNKLSIGQMMMLISASNFFLGSMNDIFGFAISFINFRREVKLFEEVIDLKDEEKNQTGIVAAKIKELFFENFCFSFDKKIFEIPFLNINSNIKIIGKNGCGKSTFMKVISSLAIGNGEFRINDLSQQLYSLDSLRSNVMLISQSEHLPKVKVLDYICDNKESKEIFEYNLKQPELIEIIKNSGISLNQEIIDGGNNFSAGQKQIIMLLKIFAHQPKLLLLDEAFENVDTTIFELFKNLLARHPEIIIEISHSKRFVSNGKEVDFEIYSSK